MSGIYHWFLTDLLSLWNPHSACDLETGAQLRSYLESGSRGDHCSAQTLFALEAPAVSKHSLQHRSKALTGVGT